ncbi:MAG: DUF6011 domain-containing protein [Gammaproteobacteria bacterium]|nr:DUF6011 domain-containing protein [Gammaproteobacteria bacterium]
MNDFAKWLQEYEVKDTRTLRDPRPGGDDEDFRPAIQTGNVWKPAKWDRANPGNHECFSCRGSGLWSPPVYATRGKTGKCHKCQGRGHFKTSAAERAKAREYRRVTTANDLQSAKDEFMASHKELVDFLESVKDWNDFARNLLQGEYGLAKRGRLSDKQVAAAERMKAKIEAKEAEKLKSLEWQPVDNSEINLDSIPSGYYAVPDGETRLKVRINRPGPNSNWHGWTFVSDGAAYGHGKRYGRQAPGKDYNGDIIPQLLAIKADPAAASKAYGKLVGRCGVCNAILENEESVANGIGPICAGKMGW